MTEESTEARRVRCRKKRGRREFFEPEAAVTEEFEEPEEVRRSTEIHALEERFERRKSQEPALVRRKKRIKEKRKEKKQPERRDASGKESLLFVFGERAGGRAVKV